MTFGLYVGCHVDRSPNIRMLDAFTREFFGDWVIGLSVLIG